MDIFDYHCIQSFYMYAFPGLIPLRIRYYITNRGPKRKIYNLFRKLV